MLKKANNLFFDNFQIFQSFSHFRMAAPPPRRVTFGPEKGSFPLDHFKECESVYKEYMDCLKENDQIASKCRHVSRSYLE